MTTPVVVRADSAPRMLVALARDLLRDGDPVTVRGSQIREGRQRVSSITHPERRVHAVPGRTNNIVATVMETAWVLAGRDDIGWLSRYLPRAADFSDDGVVWRAAYGPRLRNWNGTDQLAVLIDLLRRDPATRQAAATIFDPDRDHTRSKDIPCTNWLHLLLREGELSLSVAMRSNDLIWGFSGINSFEFSVLQEVVANSVGATRLGPLTFYAGSLHLYERHFAQAEAIVGADRGHDIYSRGVAPTRCGLTIETLDRALEGFFDAEERIAHGDWEVALGRVTGDDLLDSGLALAAAHHLARSDAAHPGVERVLRAVVGDDLRVAGAEYLGRTAGRVDLLAQLAPDVAPLFAPAPLAVLTTAQIVEAIDQLHIEKSAVYGDSWKRRGEQISILANVARKVDRLERVVPGRIGLRGETAVDTAVDLLVYSLKYLSYLAERDRSVALDIFGGAPPADGAYSDGTEAFSLLIRRLGDPAEAASAEWALARVLAVAARMDDALADSPPPVAERADFARQLVEAAWVLAAYLIHEAPDELLRLG